MATPVSRMWTLPAEEPIAVGRPVLGRSLVGLAAALAHLGGIQAQGFGVLCSYQAPAVPDDADDVGWMVGEPDDETHRLPIYVPVGVDVVTVSLVVLALPDGGTAPSIEVSAYNSGGVAIDAGFTLDRGAGLAGLVLAGGDGDRLWPCAAQSSAARLSLSAAAGEMAILHIDTVSAMVVSALICPEWPETL